MAGYYNNIGEITNSTYIQSGQPISVPPAALEAVPFLIKNLPPDEIVYAGYQTVFRDSENGQLTIDTDDCPQPLPAAEWFLRLQPALMRAIKIIGQTVIADGFLLDCRRVAKFNERSMDLSNGTSSIRFMELQEKLGAILPEGVVFNVAGKVEYHGNPHLEEAATAMIHRVDTFLHATNRTSYVYAIPMEDTHKYKSTIAADTLAREENGVFNQTQTSVDTLTVQDTASDET